MPRYLTCFALIVSLITVSESTFAETSLKSAEVIKIDGSSTVYPIMEATAEEYRSSHPEEKITIGVSGTGGGFKKFCVGETHISNASRPIKDVEKTLCSTNKVEFIELPIAYDALTVVINPKNTWAKTMTVKDLQTIWRPEAQGKITKWNQVRAEWPDKPINLYGPGVDSGTYDYFTEVVVGKEHSSRGDYTSSEDDNVLVHGVANDENALGFFGMAYYEENSDKLTAVAIDDGNAQNGDGPQLPNREDVLSGVYVPLARPLFVYVSKSALEMPNIKRFIEFSLAQAKSLVGEVGYVELSDKLQQIAKTRLQNKVAGTIFDQPRASTDLVALYNK